MGGSDLVTFFDAIAAVDAITASNNDENSSCIFCKT